MPARQWKFALPGALVALVFGGFGLAGAIDPGLLVEVRSKMAVARVVSGVIGGWLTVVGVAGVWALLTQGGKQPQFVADDEGLAVWCKLGHAEIPWSDVAAVGVGFKVTPRPGGRKLQQGRALEVFFRSSDPAQHYPGAAAMMPQEDPPAADLPSIRLRMLTLANDIDSVLAQQTARRARYLGSCQRAWHRGPGS